MPFIETGCQKLLKKSNAKFISNFKEFNPKKIKYIFITVGTPLRESIEVNLNNINLVINELSKILVKGHTIILRSTIGPETTEYVKKIEKLTNFKVGKDIFLSFCPERLAENKALKELGQLPQIIGVEDNKTFLLVERVFKRFKIKIFKTSFSLSRIGKII